MHREPSRVGLVARRGRAAFRGPDPLPIRLGHAVAVALALSLASPSSAAHEGGRRPNVIVVMTDDQGYGDLACHGNPELKTPNLDRLHAESLRLTDFHVTPMCTPTRGQLLTGIDALRNGAMNVSSGRSMIRRGIPTMADLFASGGYRTGQFGKWHVGDVYPYRPQDRGFEASLFFPSSHIGSAADRWNNDYFDDVYQRDGKRRPFEGYCTDVFFDEAMRWIRARKEEGQPFLAYIPTNAPHSPHFVPDRYREPYRHLAPNVASFFGMIANIDENMGRLDVLLRESGLRDETILVFLTDNGGTAGVPIFNAGMRGRKTELFEGGHRVPCFVRWPSGGLRPPADVDGLACVQDLLPTLLELAGLEPPADSLFDGISLAPRLRGDSAATPDRTLVIQFSRVDRPVPVEGNAAVLWRRWRLINDEDLYDLESDPGQERDVAKDHPEVVDRLRTHYDRWWSRVAPELNDLSPIHVGSDAEDPVLLSACDWRDVFLDQQRQVRRGERKEGPWGVVVEREGEYEIALRRWPEEADLPIRSGAPAYQGEDGTYPAGEALPIAGARLRVGEVDESMLVGLDDRASTFRVRLPAGRAQLRGWFTDTEGSDVCGAYYVYVRRADSSPP